MPRKQKAEVAYNREKILQLLDTNYKAVLRAAVVIYDKQTDLEKDTETTCVRNGVGFGAFDARVLSVLAKKIINKEELNHEEYLVLRTRIRKYAQQLADIANEKIDRDIKTGVNVRVDNYNNINKNIQVNSEVNQ